MNLEKRSLWVIVVLVVIAVALPLYYFLPRDGGLLDDPWSSVIGRPYHTDHAALMSGPFEDGPAVTRACLECHENEAHEVGNTPHFRWEGDPVTVPGRSEQIRLGKQNIINNFCNSIQSNWVGCTSCHAGYGWEDDSYDHSDHANVDCLVCHDQSGQYVKQAGGYPAPGVDLVLAAQSVASPTRNNCGGCHFRGGGGDAVKHGDLDATLSNPRPRVDVHMGAYDLTCVDCHRTVDHDIRGRALSVSVDTSNQVQCTDCHSEAPHLDDRLNSHLSAVACETCHIRRVALREATKTHWDWSAAGQDLPESTHEYLKKKGRFEYEQLLIPEYYWFNETSGRYLLGDSINPSRPTVLNPPQGDINDPDAKIRPFKVHRATQIYDTNNRYLLVPKTVGEGGYWADFDWDQAARLGSEVTGLEYSGSYGFAETEMFWPLSHMVQSGDESLQCRDCHGEDGRMDWRRLGYPGDPIDWGSREVTTVIASADGGIQ